MKFVPPLILACLYALTASAHPGVGIVMDARGSIYYTDLKQVWKVAPDGRTTIAVPNVHTHELALDRDGNLYGEHLWYEGDQTGKWSHRVWRRSSDGQIVDVIPPREGFLQNYSFVRDAAGTMYWADRTQRVVRRLLPDGRVEAISKPRKYIDIRWMTVTSGGTVYFVDRWDLLRVEPDGSVTTVARDLARPGLLARVTPPGARHAIMGLWTDAADNVYLAVTSDREIKKVTKDGRVSVVARSRLPWSPTGGLVAPNGDLWVLEYAGPLSARARKVSISGTSDGMAPNTRDDVTIVAKWEARSKRPRRTCPVSSQRRWAALKITKQISRGSLGIPS